MSGSYLEFMPEGIWGPGTAASVVIHREEQNKDRLVGRAWSWPGLLFPTPDLLWAPDQPRAHTLLSEHRYAGCLPVSSLTLDGVHQLSSCFRKIKERWVLNLFLSFWLLAIQLKFWFSWPQYRIFSLSKKCTELLFLFHISRCGLTGGLRFTRAVVQPRALENLAGHCRILSCVPVKFGQIMFTYFIQTRLNWVI